MPFPSPEQLLYGCRRVKVDGQQVLRHHVVAVSRTGRFGTSELSSIATFGLKEAALEALAMCREAELTGRVVEEVKSEVKEKIVEALGALVGVPEPAGVPEPKIGYCPTCGAPGWPAPDDPLDDSDIPF